MSLSLRMTISRECERAGVVHRLVGHARRHRAVADHRDRRRCRACDEIARHRHAEAGRNRGRGMRGAERVVFALRALGEAGQAAALAQRADAVAPPGQDLVRIGLMADVPDQPVARRVEDIMQRHGQFDDAEARAEMPARHRDRADRLGAQFIGEPPEIPTGNLRRSAGVRTRSSSGVFDCVTIILCRAAGPIRRRETSRLHQKPHGRQLNSLASAGQSGEGSA